MLIKAAFIKKYRNYINVKYYKNNDTFFLQK